jgi:hypothetical protein
MIQRHAQYTRSQRAFKILALWEEMVPKFVKVMPKDYKRVLQSIKRAEASRPERRGSRHGRLRRERQRRGARRRRLKLRDWTVSH